MSIKVSSNELTLVKIGVIAQSVGQVILGLVGMVVIKLMTTGLGSHKYGIYSTAFALVSTFTLVTDLGVNTATLREISKFPDRASDIISHNLSLRLLIALVAVPLVLALGLVFYPHGPRELRTIIPIMACYLIFDAVWSTCVVYFSAKLRNDIATVITVFQQLLFLALVVFALLSKWGIVAYVLAYVLSFAATSFIAFYLVHKRIKVRPLVSLSVWKRTMYLSVGLGLINILNQIYHVADTVMLSIFKGTLQVGIYTVAYSLVGIFLFFPDYIMGNLTPVIIKKRNDPKLFELFSHSLQLLVCLGLLVPLISYYIGPDMVMIVSNKNYITASTPFFLLTIGVACTYIAAPFIRTSIALEKQRGLLAITIATLATNILINLYTIPHYGIIGAALATATTEVVSLVAVIILFKRNVDIDIKLGSYWRQIIPAILTFLILQKVNLMPIKFGAMPDALIGGVTITGTYILLLSVFRGLPVVLLGPKRTIFARFGSLYNRTVPEVINK